MLDSWPENEVRKISRVWQDHAGGSWLVVFDLANLRGRIECVGVALRSCLGPAFDAAYQPTDEELDAAMDSPLWKWVDPVPQPLEEVFGLRPLLATTLRQLPFDDVLVRARRSEARSLENLAVTVAELAEAYPEAMEAASPPGLDLRLQQEAELYEPRGKAGGRRSKYSPEFLRRVAAVYQAAFEEGIDPPAKRVEQALGLTPDVARKLIHRCRDPHLRLLPPTKPTRPRGWLAGERGEATTKDPPAD